ncbi:TonB-dependent receptor [candidate division KSB1 bacterium]|nr:TonB-dependent receptor [candidate division KSB1 bacterium]
MKKSSTIQYWIIIIYGLVTILWLKPVAAQKGRGTIEGKIVSAETKEGLPGANIQIEGSLLGASADLKGHFLIRKVPIGSYTLHFTMIGYEKKVLRDVKVVHNTITQLNVPLKETVIGMNPVIVTASKRRQDMSITPHSISVVSSSEIMQRAPLRLDQALENVSGVHFVEGSISIRGSSGYTRGIGSRILLLVDGVPLMISDTNEINWNLLPILDVEQVEVIKGAGSALYGSNALGGIVNVITRAPTLNGSLKYRSLIGVYDQPYLDYWKWTQRQLYFHQFQVGMGKSFKFQNLPGLVKYTVLPFFFWPWQSQVEEVGLQTTFNQHNSTGYREDGYFSRWNLSFRADHIFNDGAKFTTYAGFSFEKRAEFIEWETQNEPLDVSYWWRNRRILFRTLDAYVLYHKPLSPLAALKLRGSFITSLFADQYDRSGDYYPATGTGAECQLDWLPQIDHNVTFGVELKSDGGHTKFIGKRRGYSIAPYIQDEWHPFQQLTITPGLRYDMYQIMDSPFREDQWCPKFGINYSPRNGTTLRFSGGTAFRAASVTERFISAKFRYFPIIPNEKLKAETSVSYDIGLYQQITANWYMDVAVFYNNYKNFIEPVEEMDDHFNVFVQFRNITRAQVQGVELSTKGRWWHNRLGLQANATWMEAKDLSQGKYLAYRPKFMGTLTPALQLGPVEFQVDYRYLSRFDEVKLFDLDERIAQHVLNLRLSYEWKKVQFMVSINNLFNYHYTQLERNLGEIRHLTTSLNFDL